MVMYEASATAAKTLEKETDYKIPSFFFLSHSQHNFRKAQISGV